MSLRSVALVLTPLVLLLGGCSAVTSDAPVGDKIEALDPKDWNGLWVFPQGLRDEDDSTAVRLVVSDAKNGVISASTSYLDHDAGRLVEDELKILTGNLYVRRSDSSPGYWLISQKASEFNETSREGHGWVIASRRSRQLILWVPNADAFKDLVTNGALHGEVFAGRYSTYVHLGELTAEDLALISSRDGVLSARREPVQPGLILFYWDNPLVFTRQ